MFVCTKQIIRPVSYTHLLSLFDFYGRFGFTGVFNIYERKYIPEESSSSFEAANNTDIGVLMSFYEKYKEKMKKCDVCVYRSKSLFESLIKEYSAGAGTDVIYNEKCIAFIEYSEDCIIIKEYAGEIDAQSISDFFGKYVYLQEPFIFRCV